MDHTLGVVIGLPMLRVILVLILVLVDHALGAFSRYVKDTISAVLILVLVDHALGVFLGVYVNMSSS